MIARSAQTAAVALLAATLLGLALPQAALAHDRDSRSYGYQYVDHHDHDDHDDEGDDDGPRRHHGWEHRHEYNQYAPRYYPDVVVYPPAPRAYYYEPRYLPVEPVYPRDYGTVGIHLDYNLLY